MKNKIQYEFTHLQTSLISFISDFEKKTQFIFPEIPVLFENIDDSYILFNKYAKTELQELYSKLPRIVVGLQDVQGQLENNTTQFLKTNYTYKDVDYRTQFRRISTAITIELKIVCSNYLKALSYWEFLLTLLCIDNTFTYEHFGNTFQGSYLMQNTPTIEKGMLNNATSDSKNSIVNCTLEINIQPIFLNVRTIEELSNSSLLIDTDIIDDGSNNYNYSIIDEEIINSKINSIQDYNDLSINSEEEKKLLKNRKRIKIAANNFDIDSKLNNDESLTYNTKLNTDINL